MPTPKLFSSKTNTSVAVAPVSMSSKIQPTPKMNLARRLMTTTSTIPTIPRKSTSSSASTTTIPAKISRSKITATTMTRLSHSAASTPRQKKDTKTTIPTIPSKLMMPRKSTSTSASTTTIPAKISLSKITTTTMPQTSTSSSASSTTIPAKISQSKITTATMLRLSHSAASTPRQKKDTKTIIPTIPSKLMMPRKSTSTSVSTTTIPAKISLSKTTKTTILRLSYSAASTPRDKKNIKTTHSTRTLLAPRPMTTKTKFSSPFKSFVTSGLSVRNRTKSADFAYDLSNDERLFMGSFKSPMKAVPDGERELLKNGQRGAYLALRYEHSPDRKYNFPEATSWRIGWLHNCQAKQQNS